MKNKRAYFILLAVVLLIVTTGFSQQSKEKKAFIWKVTTDGNTGYLVGSIHMLKKESYPLPETLGKAFSMSDGLVLEIDMSGEEMAKVQVKLMSKGMYQDKTTLKDNISAKTYEFIRKKLKEKYNADISLYSKYKPWFLALFIESMELLKMGFNPQYGIDMHFLQKAKKSKKEILGLETAEFQIGLFETFSQEEQEILLLYTFEEMEQSKKYINDIVNTWSTGDAKKMEEILFENLEKNPDFKRINKVLLDDRNKNMASRIDELMKTGKTYFVVVGAAHLIGPKGIISLLEDRGYSIRQL